MATEKNTDVWFICTKNFVCGKCGKSNSISRPLKASTPLNKELMQLAMHDQPLVCEECNEPFQPAPSDQFEFIPATKSEADVFESNPTSQTS